MIKKLFIFCYLFVYSTILFSQNTDSLNVKKIVDEALTNSISYNNLGYLCTKIGGRICGSPQAAEAVAWSKKVMEELKFDTVYLQELKVHHWVRGAVEKATVTSTKFGESKLSICSLGESVGTGSDGITAQVVEVKNFEELKNLGSAKIKGKIVFFNRPMDQTFFQTFPAYGGAADQRVHGAEQASLYGAIGVIVRSLTLENDDFPHTGVMSYGKAKDSIPAVAVSTMGADKLSLWLKSDPTLQLSILSDAKFYPEVSSYNVIGELKGTKFPNEYITVGGHLDAWDISSGAHDDGVGCMQSIEVLRIFKALGIKPKHTIRAVMFMDEEIAQRGGKKYAELAKLKKEKHIFAIESDRGGLCPTGFSIDAGLDTIKKILKWKKFFEAYGIHEFEKGGSGVDISPLKILNFPLVGLVTESQRYFNYHHCANDTFDKVNRREMQLGSAAMAALIYFIDKYGY